MAGWPFDELALNVKCLVFSGGLVWAYMNLPCRYDANWRFSVVFIALGSYVGLAWYDSVYNCDVKMRQGITSILTGRFKPTAVGGVYGG